MERLVSANPPARSCIQDTVLCPADPAVRYLLGQAAQPGCALAQLIVVAAERPVHEYTRWIGRQAASLPSGRIGVVDCFSDPCGWHAAWVARPPPPPPDVEVACGSVRVTKATRDGGDGFESVVAAVRRLHIASQGGAGAASKSGSGREGKKTLVLIDSVSYLLLRRGVKDVIRLLHRLGALPATCVAFVLHTGRASSHGCLSSLTTHDLTPCCLLGPSAPRTPAHAPRMRKHRCCYKLAVASLPKPSTLNPKP